MLILINVFDYITVFLERMGGYEGAHIFIQSDFLMKVYNETLCSGVQQWHFGGIGAGTGDLLVLNAVP